MTTVRLTAAFLAMLASMSASFAGGTLNVPTTVSPKHSPTMIVQAAQIQRSTANSAGDRTIGVCYKLESRGAGLDLMFVLEEYFKYVEKKEFKVIGKVNIKIIQKPAHGEVSVDSGGGDYIYQSSNAYEGRDHVTFLVEANGHKFTLVYFIHVVDFVENHQSLCPKFNWRIALNQASVDLSSVGLVVRAVSWTGYDISNSDVHLNIQSLGSSWLHYAS